MCSLQARLSSRAVGFGAFLGSSGCVCSRACLQEGRTERYVLYLPRCDRHGELSLEAIR